MRRLSISRTRPASGGSAIALLPLALAAGCSGTCKKSTPYVPFLEDAGPISAKTGDPAAGDAAADGGHKPAFKGVQAALAPPGSAKWTLDGLSFEAPAGNVIVAALANDLDGDGQKDIVAYVQPPGGGGGELRFHRGDGNGGLLGGRAVTGTTAGAEVTLPSPCLAKPSPAMMTLVGPHSIALDLLPTCGEAAPAPRRFVFAAFAPTPSIRWSARVTDPPAGFKLGLEVEALDVDGDGIDDPMFLVTLEGGGAPFEPGDRLQARLPYWDRPAGLARDRKYPELSFQTVAQSAAGRATSKKKETARQVAGIVQRLRLLHAAICAEAGAPWLEIGGERGVSCGASKALEDAGFAEIKAALSLGDVVLASAARERLSAGAVARTNKTRSEIDRAIEAAAATVWGTARDLKAQPSTPSKGAPAWGALAFEKGGALLVRTATGVVRVDQKTFEEKEADDVTSWPWEVTLPEKDARLSAVADPCDAPYLGARVAGHDVPTGSTLLPLPMIPQMGPGRCGGATTIASVPVAWGAQGLYTLVAHEPVIVPASVTGPGGGRAMGTLPPPNGAVDGAFVMGSPRSPSGGFLVVPTRFGLLRRDDGSGGASVFVKVKDLEGLYSTALRECAIADGGTRLACLREIGPVTKVVLIDASNAAGAPPPPEE